MNIEMPKIIEGKREKYIVRKLKEMLEDAFYTKLTERPEVEKIEVEKFDSVEELLEEMRRLFPSLEEEINLWYKIRELTTLAEVEEFWKENIGTNDLESIEKDIGEEFDDALKNANPQKPE